MLINLSNFKRIEQILGIEKHTYEFVNESWDTPPENSTYNSTYVEDVDCSMYTDDQRFNYYTHTIKLNYFGMDRNSIYLRKLSLC